MFNLGPCVSDSAIYGKKSFEKGKGMVEIAVVAADILQRPCDLLLLKYADGFYGVDALVSKRLGFTAVIPQGKETFLPGRNIEAKNVLFIGVGRLGDFRYEQIREFGRKALEFASRNLNSIEIICSPIHGPGYGLDEREAFLSLVGGFLDGIDGDKFPRHLQRIEIVEVNERRAERIREILASAVNQSIQLRSKRGSEFHLSSKSQHRLSSFGIKSEEKPKLFVAMPFGPKYSDVWDISIVEACQKAEIVCERLDQQAYTGDILNQIKLRLQDGSGILALLDGANPNVFLEIGFAWGAGKPSVLMAKKGTRLPFDVQGQKCIQYTSIANLRDLLTAELISLKSQNAFTKGRIRSRA